MRSKHAALGAGLYAHMEFPDTDAVDPSDPYPNGDADGSSSLDATSPDATSPDADAVNAREYPHADAVAEALADATTQVTGAPTTSLAAHPVTGQVHARAKAAPRALTDLPPAARKVSATSTSTPPVLPEVSAWSPVEPMRRSVSLLDAAIVDGSVDEDVLGQGVSLALAARDWAALADASSSLHDVQLSSALAYAAMVVAWRVGVDDRVSPLAASASLPGTAVHPLLTANSSALCPARSLDGKVVRLPLSDATAAVLTCWPRDPSRLPDPEGLSAPLRSVGVYVCRVSGVTPPQGYVS